MTFFTGVDAKIIHALVKFKLVCSDVDPNLLDPYYGRLAGSGSVWKDTNPDPGLINVLWQKSFVLTD